MVGGCVVLRVMSRIFGAAISVVAISAPRESLAFEERPLLRIELKSSEDSEARSSRRRRLSSELRELGVETFTGARQETSFFMTRPRLAELRTRVSSMTLAALEDAEITEGRSFRAIERERSFDTAVPGYPELDEIESRMRDLAELHPDFLEFVDLTQMLQTPATAQGRHLYAVRVGDEASELSDDPRVFIVSGHHAREVITPVIALETLERIAAGRGTDDRIDRLVEDHEIWIAPIWNPDGYQHVFDRDNYWRKNRRPLNSGNFGVDLNRNYDFAWDGPCGGQTATDHETYRGPSASSEPETQTAEALGEKLFFAKVIDFHSHGREVLWGYANCNRHPFDNYARDGARRLASAARYSSRLPTANGEHVQWHRVRGTWNYLVETHVEFQPRISSAESEAERVWPLIVEAIDWPAPVSGRVVDACTNQGLGTRIDLTNVQFRHDEHFLSDPVRGRFDIFAPDGPQTLSISRTGYTTLEREIEFDNDAPQEELLVRLHPVEVDEEVCDGIDNDCDGLVDELPECDQDTSSSDGGESDDGDDGDDDDDDTGESTEQGDESDADSGDEDDGDDEQGDDGGDDDGDDDGGDDGADDGDDEKGDGGDDEGNDDATDGDAATESSVGCGVARRPLRPWLAYALGALSGRGR